MWKIFQQNLIGKRAPDISGEVWFNKASLPKVAQARIKLHKPLRFANDLAGNVVLIDFWDYSCVNCVKTLPYLREWWKRYRNLKFLIIGVHTPEFGFGKDPDKVRNAILRFNLNYPVVSDPDYLTWKRYNNNVWPRKFLVDAQGVTQYDRKGEGGYEETEQAIQKLLRQLHPDVDFKQPVAPFRMSDRPGAVCKPATPEIYLGWQRGRPANDSGVVPGQVSTYTAPEDLALHKWALSGRWKIREEELVHPERDFRGEDVLTLKYSAQEVFSVMRSVGGGEARIEVQQDEKPLNESNKGEDIILEDGKSFIRVHADRLYKVVSNPEHGEHTLILVPRTEQIAIHTFTFSGECE